MEPSDDVPADAEVDDESVVSDPAELIRLANMLQALMVEVHEVTLDEGGRRRLFDVQHRAVEAIKDVVSDDLDTELEDLGLPLQNEDATVSELRIAQAQLVGWLNGLFQGIQAAMFARRLGPNEQLQQMQRQLAQQSQSRPPGQYL